MRLIIAIIIALLVFLAWLGSERAAEQQILVTQTENT